MTSLLRRKRRTTARSTPPPKVRKTPAGQADVSGGTCSLSVFLAISFGGALLVGLVGSLRSSSAAAADWTAGQSVATAARYSTQPQGHKLKWLPYRPSKSRLDGVAGTTGRVARTVSASEAQTAQRALPEAFADPFQDREAKSSSAAPARMLTDQVIERPEPGPASGDLQVEFGHDEPVPAADLQAAQRPGELPTLDEAYADRGSDDGIKCPSPEDKKFFTPINKLTIDTSATDGDFPPECPVTDKTFDKALRPNTWAPTTFAWKASGVCHQPLYFEAVHLERYGHSWGPYLQPIISGGHFFLTVPALPYLMGLTPPCEPMYTLGYYRPGSCAPYMLDPLPLSVRAALAAGGAWTGMAYLVP